MNLCVECCLRTLLVQDYGFLRRVNVWPPFVTLGIYCSALSAAMSTLIGASRILHALALDQLFGKGIMLPFCLCVCVDACVCLMLHGSRLMGVGPVMYEGSCKRIGQVICVNHFCWYESLHGKQLHVTASEIPPNEIPLFNISG